MNRGRGERMTLKALGPLMFAAAALVTGAGLLVLYRYTSPAIIDAWLEVARPWLFLWRACLFGSLIACWPWVCRGLARASSLTEDQRAQLLAARWILAPWLVVLELLLGQNVVGHFIHLVASP